MHLDLLFLGTAGSAPTASRGTSATLVRRGGDKLLLDCGEGTQRQLLRSDAGLVDLEHVFLTHLHADHVLGLPGMLKTFALRGRELPIVVYGPRGTTALLDALGVVIGRLTYELRITELSPGDGVEREGYRLVAFAVKHGSNALGGMAAPVRSCRKRTPRNRGTLQGEPAEAPDHHRTAARS